MLYLAKSLFSNFVEDLFNGFAHSALDIPVEIVEHNAKVFGEGFADRCLAGAHVSYDDD